MDRLPSGHGILLSACKRALRGEFGRAAQEGQNTEGSCFDVSVLAYSIPCYYNYF